MVSLVLIRTIWRTGQRWNYGVVGLVGLLALANAAVHTQTLGILSGPHLVRCGSPPT